MKTCNIDLNNSFDDVDDPLFDQSLDNVSWEIEGRESEQTLKNKILLCMIVTSIYNKLFQM